MARETERDRTEQQNEGVRVADLVRKCDASRQSRRVINETNRGWYERGVNEGPRARYNKLRPHLDRVASYLFSPETVRFGVHLPADSREEWLPAAATARDEFRERWHDAGAGLVCAGLIEWSLVDGCRIAKVQYDAEEGFSIGHINPGDFGVLQEDKPDPDRQPAMSHWYSVSIPEVERWLDGTPRLDRLVDIARERATVSNTGSGIGQQGLVISSVTGIFPGGTIQGGFPGEPDVSASSPGPIVDEPTVTFVDVWEYRQFRRRAPYPGKGPKTETYWDWLVTTMIDGTQEVFLQRRNPELPWTRLGHDIVLPGEHPFVPVRPRPLPDYFWGRSELADLRLLQQWSEDHLNDIKAVEKRRLDPSNFVSGYAGTDEELRALNTPAGFVAAPDPGARITPNIPPLEDDAFKIIAEINSMFRDASGIPDVLEGQGQPGVRATGQLTTLAGIGAGRILRMALIVEDPLGEIATKCFHILQRHDAHRYPLPDGKGAFLLAQLPPGLTLRVNAHSHAPIFAEQTMAKALALQRANALDPEDLVELLDMPDRERLKANARKRAQAQAERSERLLEIQAEKARPKPRK
jgi:hypothetical protein